MDIALLEQAIELAEKANAGLEPELLPGPEARRLLGLYARLEKIGAFGVTALARKIDDASSLARITGTSLGKAKDTVATGKALAQSGALNEALKHGEVSLDQATEIAKAEESAPGAAAKLLAVAKKEPLPCSRKRLDRPSWRPNNTRVWGSVSALLAVLVTTQMSSAWSTSTWPSNRTSEPRSWRAPRPKLSALPGQHERPAPQNLSSATSPMPTPSCCPAQERAGPSVPNSWCWSATRSPREAGKMSARAKSARSRGLVRCHLRSPKRSPRMPS